MNCHTIILFMQSNLYEHEIYVMKNRIFALQNISTIIYKNKIKCVTRLNLLYRERRVFHSYFTILLYGILGINTF